MWVEAQLRCFHREQTYKLVEGSAAVIHYDCELTWKRDGNGRKSMAKL